VVLRGFETVNDVLYTARTKVYNVEVTLGLRLFLAQS
jgi:hypothetical protein